MNDPLDILNELRKKKVAIIDKCQSEINECENAIREVSGELAGIDEAIAALRQNGASTHASGTLPLIGKYSAMKLTPAVEDVIATQGSGNGLLVPEIIAKLLAEGFKERDAKKLYGSVYPVAQRLVAQGKAKEGKKQGKRSFMRKQMTLPAAAGGGN